MAATFILSLDCEGKWGVADHLDAQTHQSLADARLRTAYRDILAALNRYDIAATFAFVGLFAQGKAGFPKVRPLVDDLAVRHAGYLGPALADIDEGSGEGWFGDWAVDDVMAASQPHEIGFHGASHIPWDELDADDLTRELDILSALEGPVRSSRTMVFPRNRVAHVDRLADAGLQGYRAARVRSRAANLLSEFNPFALSEQPSRPTSPSRIPAGYFVNYQHGLRTMVPRRLSQMRAEHLVAHAVRTEGIVHFWLHPENLASAPATLENLDDILCIVARERDKGRCMVQTQLDYCNGLVG